MILDFDSSFFGTIYGDYGTRLGGWYQFRSMGGTSYGEVVPVTDDFSSFGTSFGEVVPFTDEFGTIYGEFVGTNLPLSPRRYFLSCYLKWAFIVFKRTILLQLALGQLTLRFRFSERFNGIDFRYFDIAAKIKS